MAVGRRRTVDLRVTKPTSVADVFLGTMLLWFGWFGFNGIAYFFLLWDQITFLFSIKNLSVYSKVEASSCPIVELETPSSLPTWPHALAVSLGWLSIHVERKTANFL